MFESLAALIQQDPVLALRVIAFLIGLIGVAGIFQIIRRSSRDADTIRRTLERREARVDELEDDATTQTSLRAELMERLARAEAELSNCQERLKQSGAGSLTPSEELTLRSMVVRLKQDNERKDEIIRKLRGQQNKGDYRE